MIEKFKILITGANSDLGCPISHSLFDDGHKLSLHYHSAIEPLISLKSESVFLEKADLTNDNNCENLINTAVEKMGGLDVIINMIGPYVTSDLLAMTPKEWRMVIDLNLNLAFSISSFAFPHFKHSKGHIINFCYDGVETLRSWRSATAYGAAKAGLAILTKSLAASLGGFGARANAICPGYVDFGHFSKETRHELLQSIAIGRFVQPHEIVALVNWLIKDSPNSMTGALLAIGGGWEHKA